MTKPKAENLPITNALQKYDWRLWLDGRRWTLIKGDHFDCTLVSIVRLARQWGEKRGIYVRSRTLDRRTIQIQGVTRGGKRLIKGAPKPKRVKRRLR